MKIGVIGAGYVGLTTGLALAYVGHDVVAVDNDEHKLRLLRQGRSPIHEFGMEELMPRVAERMTFTNDLRETVADADVIVIAVGTPPKDNGEADTQYVESAARDIAEHLQPDREYVLIVKSTVPIGSNRRIDHLVSRGLEQRGVQARVHIASNPEFLREGRALFDMLYPGRIVVGARHSDAVDTIYHMYRPLIEQTFSPPEFLPRPEDYKLPSLITTDPTSAEISKYGSNAFLALKISFINEMAGLCEKVGADVTQVSRVMGLDDRIGPQFLSAGLGWGGSCLPKDTAALMAVAGEFSYDMHTIAAAREVNDQQRKRIVEKLQSSLKVLRGQVIGVMGLAFKPHTDDVRSSAAVDLVRRLVDTGAHVRVHDPLAMDTAAHALEGVSLDYCEDAYELAHGADALLLATEWPQYAALDLSRLAGRMRHPLLVDARNLFNPEDVRAAGFEYTGVGR